MSSAGGGGGGRVFLTAVIAQGEAVGEKPGVGRVFQRSEKERAVSWTTDRWAHATRSRVHTRQVLLLDARS